MYCNKCGKIIDDGAVFCTNCGKKLDAVPPVTIAEQEAEATAEPVAETNTAEQSTDTPVYTNYNPFNNGVYEQPVDPLINDLIKAQEAKEKTYFGKGALAFCLVVIGLLSISTGVFAGLYFSLIR